MIRRYCVSIDCFLDTRLGTLATLDPAYLSTILAGGTPYFKRVIDDFEWLGSGVTRRFKERYATRDIEVLKNSFKTSLVPFMTQLLTSIMLEAHEHPVWNAVGIDVNFWPYKLTAAQQALFSEVISDAIGGEDNGEAILDFEIRMVSIPLKDMSMASMKRDWQGVYMYDFIEWTDLHAQEFRDTEMTALEVELHVPALFREMIDRKSLRRSDGTHINPFDETKRHLALWIRLNYVNPQMFSIPDPDELTKPA